MNRVKIKFPDYKAIGKVTLPVRISDINYGGHLGNDSVLSLIHEARVNMLNGWGYTELNAGGVGMIMADVMIAYKAEAFYGDILVIEIYAENITGHSFDLLYKLITEKNNVVKTIAEAKTGMICYNYESRKIDAMPEELKNWLTGV